MDILTPSVRSYLDSLPGSLAAALNNAGSPRETVRGTASYLNRQKDRWFAEKGITVDLTLAVTKKRGEWFVVWNTQY